MREILIVLGVICALFIAFSVMALVAIYWTHYPYGRKRRRKWRRK